MVVRGPGVCLQAQICGSGQVPPLCTSAPQEAKRVPDSFVLAVVYRPPGPYSVFLDEFSDFAADLATYSDNILLIGDFNIHVNNPSDSLATAFLSTADTLGFKQLVQNPHLRKHAGPRLDPR